MKKYKGNIHLTRQEDVNSFPSGIEKIDGNLVIGYADDLYSLRSDINDLSPLRNIVHITKSLKIQRNKDLINLNGLDKLQTIGKDFVIKFNDTLKSFGEFPALQSVGCLNFIGGHFEVSHNNKLVSLGNFPLLKILDGHFIIEYNRESPVLEGFSALESVGGFFEIKNNDSLTTLGVFSFLQTIKSHFIIKIKKKVNLTEARAKKSFPVLKERRPLIVNM